MSNFLLIPRLRIFFFIMEICGGILSPRRIIYNATISVDFQHWRSLRGLDIWENCSWGHLTFQQSSGTPNATNSTLGLVYTEGKLRPYCNAIICLWVCFLLNFSLKGQRVYLIVNWDDLRWTTFNAQMLFTLNDSTSHTCLLFEPHF